MGLTETLVFYLVLGVAVAAAMFLLDDRRTPRRTIFLVVTAVIFWPLYLPLLLSAAGTRTLEQSSTTPSAPANADEMAAAIAQVEVELDTALSSLGGWAEDALACEEDRIAELRAALAAQATRIREMDTLLDRIAASPVDVQPAVVSHPSALSTGEEDTCGALERLEKSQQARAQNLARLTQVRRQTHADLMATLAWIRELVSMIHLAKFTGAPASRAEELVAQIAAAVEGVSAVAWQEPQPPFEPPRSAPANQLPRPRTVKRSA